MDQDQDSTCYDHASTSRAENVLASLKNVSLADLLSTRRDDITRYWIEFTRILNLPHYASITDDQLMAQLAPTVDSMISAFRKGDVSGPRAHAFAVIRQRIEQGFPLPELMDSLYGLKDSVYRIIDQTDMPVERKLEAVISADRLHHRVSMIVADAHQKLQSDQQAKLCAGYELSTIVGQTLDLDVVLKAAAESLAKATNAKSVAILTDGENGQPYRLRASFKLPAELEQAVMGICQALASGATVLPALHGKIYACTVREMKENKSLAEWASELAKRGYHSLACIPIVSAGQQMGNILIFTGEPHAFENGEVEFLGSLMGHIASAIRNARLYEEAKGKRELRLLLDAATLFTSTLDLKEILKELTRLTAENTDANHAMVYLPDSTGQRLHIVAQHSRDRQGEEFVKLMTDLVEPEGLEIGQGGPGTALLTGETLFIRDYSQFSARLEPLVGKLGSALIVPIKLRGKMLGVFTLGSAQRNKFDDEDRYIAEGVADEAAIALENARLYEKQRNIAETLQLSFLPDKLPEIAGYELAASYQPALAEAEVGGDFYDAFSPDGDHFALLVADVSGKGLEAAVHTAMGKYMIRAYAAEDPSPCSVLSRFNDVFCKYTTLGLFITGFYALLDLKNHVLTYANAGHSQPVFFSSSKNLLSTLETTGTALGVMSGAEYGERTMRIEPGDVLFMYTDGATDVRRNGVMLDYSGLECLLRTHLRSPALTIASEVLRGIVDYGEGKLADDVVLMVLRGET